MDPIKILKRAWHIVWSYRVLWIFGFILALTTSGSSGGSGNSGSRYNISEREEFQMPANMEREFDNIGQALNEFFDKGLTALERQLDLQSGDLKTMVWVIVAFVVIIFLFSLVMAAVRYVTETAVIRMVDEYDASETKRTFREGWRLGWDRRAWKLFLINLIVNIPTFLLLGFFVVLGFSIYQTATIAGGSEAMWVGFMGIIALVIGILLVFAILMIFLNLLRHFFWRKAVLEELGVRDSFRDGWQLFKGNRKNIGLMWLVMLGVGIAWGIVSIILAVIALPVVAVTVIAAAMVAAIPAALLAAFFSLFLGSYLPWIAGGLFVLPLFFTLAFSPWVFIGGLWQVYTSTAWTLVYREITVIPLPQDDDPEIEIVALDVE